ncbi:penicillin-insensitive murein endopeptidase [Endozoicomonas sp. SM1973]|uniref:Penicillin-insensitive murein endopeptidase n=1 Tax=Spartinivicinus marinus TaxID=2994442 RepID=A0A853IFQ1_9GAMM|nr:penicillin-insensitive murein endopeptidase [Spartinivicinus marinus]MCX4024629.1 penicillin-insensitive murein endopeptidase [Spartinivicinus marinus]NYZ66346.1 penicillin-insensitive murein endopeptidase [Spartinivicinus marinus]
MKFLLAVVLVALSFYAQAADISTCYGTTANGRLQNGVQLPSEGENFVGYSPIAQLAGWTYVHSSVKAIILNAYSQLKQTLPGKVFKYSETGFAEGGKFSPHKTHQNGLSVDFMVPVVNSQGKSVHLPTTPLNKFGYDIEFDKNSEFDNYKIDYEALAAHLVALHKAARKQGHDIWRVIFDPKLQPNLFKTKYGSYLRNNIQFSNKRSWVRHDEHYHVDFDVPCERKHR